MLDELHNLHKAKKKSSRIVDKKKKKEIYLVDKKKKKRNFNKIPILVLVFFLFFFEFFSLRLSPLNDQN